MAPKFEMLIVDDDVGLAANLRDIMEAEGYSAAVAHDGQTALTLCREKVFDLAIIDIKLPDTSGIELIGKLTELSPGMDYIISTGHASLNSAIEAFKLRNIIAYETKPLNMDNLLAIIRQVTERKQAEEELRQTAEKVRETKEMYDRVTDNADEIIFRVEPKGGHAIYVNPAGERLLGYSKAEWLADSTFGFKVIHPDFVEEQKRLIEEINTTKKRIKNAVLGWITKDGNEIFFEHTIIPIVNEKGKVIYFESIGKDITERRQAEEALRESEEKYRRLFELSPLGITTLDMKGVITSCNPAVYKEGGYSEDEIVGKHFSKIAPLRIRDIPQLMKLFSSIMRGKAPKPFELAYQREDGSVGWTEVHTALLKEHGKKLGALVIQRDITERKRAEESLKKTQDYLLKAQEIAQFGNWSWERGVDIGLWSEEIYRMLGYTTGEIQPTFEWLLGITHPDDREQVVKDIEESMRTGKSYSGVYRLTRKDGKEIIVDSRAEVVLNQAGEATGMIGVIQDITERKQAEEALRESEERYRALLELGGQVGEAVVMMQDTQQVEAIQTFVSNQWPRITGYSRKQLLGMSFFDLLHPKDREASRDRHRRKMQGESMPGLFEMSIIRRDGTEVPIELTSAHTTYQGQRANVAYIRDITERKRAEEREKQLQTELYLSGRLASIGELAAGVAHELNNPLTGILGFSERLLRKCDEEARTNLTRIHSEAKRAAKIVQNLLTFARQREPKRDYADINDILQKALELRAYELRTSNIEVVTDLAPGLPKTMVDFYQIEEVFLNIILNAEQTIVEAKKGGKLSIKTQQTKGYIRISFANDGPGIPAEHLGKLFDPFFTTRWETGGTGLGLSVCHGIVTEHGGQIYARSKPGKGTTFVVELPLTADKIN